MCEPQGGLCLGAKRLAPSRVSYRTADCRTDGGDFTKSDTQRTVGL